MSKLTNEVTQAYSLALKNWVPKAYGPKPTIEQLATVFALFKAQGLKAIGKQALLTTMRLRETGATTAQMLAVGAAVYDSVGPANNIVSQTLVPAKVVKQVKTTNEAGHTVYKLTLTDTGATKVGAVLAETPAKPAKAKKAKAVKPVAVNEPAIVLTETSQPQG